MILNEEVLLMLDNVLCGYIMTYESTICDPETGEVLKEVDYPVKDYYRKLKQLNKKIFIERIKNKKWFKEYLEANNE